MTGRKKTGGRKKSVSRQKAGGKRSAMTREEEALWRAGGVVTEGPRGTAEQDQQLRKEVLSFAQELSDLGHDPDVYDEIHVDMQSGRYSEAAQTIVGYAESFMDPYLTKQAHAIHEKIFDFVGRTQWISRLESGWQMDGGAYKYAKRIREAVAPGIPGPMHVDSPGYYQARGKQIRQALGSVSTGVGFDRQRLARIAAHLSDPKSDVWDEASADYIRDILIADTIAHKRHMATGAGGKITGRRS